MLLLSLPSVLHTAYLCAACAVGSWLYWESTTGHRRRELVKKHGCRPPRRVRMRDPIFGLDALFDIYRWTQQHTLIENMREMLYGSGTKTVEFNSLGSIVIFTAEVDNVKTVLSLKFKSFGTVDLTKELDLVLGGGIFTSQGEAWHQSRELLRPCFARAQVADLEMIERHVSTLINKIPRDGSTTDLSKFFSQLTSSAAIEFLFGDSSAEGDSVAVTASNDSFATVWDRVSSFIVGAEDGGRLWLFWFILDRMRMNPQFRRDCHTIHDHVDKLVEKSLSATPAVDAPTSTGRSHYLFLQELVSRTADRKKIRAEALNVLFAGRDTTAALLTNVFFELAKRPDIWARLSEEIDKLDGRKPSYEELKNLKYLSAVLNECLRLYPIVPSIARQAHEDTVLPLGGGDDEGSPILVKKGQLVVLDMYVIHRRKDLYGEDADVFRPERWLDTEDQKGLRMGWGYLPFSGGPRVCIGQNFAITEVSYTTVRLMQEFGGRLESRDPEPWRERINFIVSSLGGCKVGLFPRGAKEGGE